MKSPPNTEPNMTLAEKIRNFPYWSEVETPNGKGRVCGQTSRTVRVFHDWGGSTNRGRHSGEGHTRGYHPDALTLVTR